MGASADARLEERKNSFRQFEFPLYLMEINGKRKYMPMQAAGLTYDSGLDKVDIVGDVLESDFSVRRITPEEEQKISDIADRHSNSK